MQIVGFNKMAILMWNYLDAILMWNYLDAILMWNNVLAILMWNYLDAILMWNYGSIKKCYMIVSRVIVNYSIGMSFWIRIMVKV
jgi:hypothetical protein